MNTTTTKLTGTWVNMWRTERQIGQIVEEIPKEHTDGILQLFFAEIHKNSGTNYEPHSLRTMMAAHLQEKGSTFSILKDWEFDTGLKVPNGKVIELQEQGLCKRKHLADPQNLNCILPDRSADWHPGMPRTPSGVGRTHEVCQQYLYWNHWVCGVGWRTHKNKASRT